MNPSPTPRSSSFYFAQTLPHGDRAPRTHVDLALISGAEYVKEGTGPGEYDWSSMTMKSFLNILSPVISAHKSRVGSRSFWRRVLSSRSVPVFAR
jgi:hypothetical protein